jgi:coatomer subunit beta
MFELLNSSSHAVKYEAATTLTTLTQNPAAVKGIFAIRSCAHTHLPSSPAAASCFVNLVIKESDNNVKLIVLDRLDTLRSKHGHILDGLTMDILQVLSRYEE